MRMVVELEGFAGFEELYKNSWSGAIDRLDTIKHYHMEEEFMEHLDMVFECCGELPTDTEVNDYLAYEFSAEEFIAENIPYNTLEDLLELTDYVKNLGFNDALATIQEVERQDKEEKLWEYLQYSFDMRSLYEVIEELNEFDFDELD